MKQYIVIDIDIYLVIFVLACDPGKYGYRCNDTCGQCRDKGMCFHTNGSCLSGCDTGYYGDLCKTGKKCLIFYIRNTIRRIYQILSYTYEIA